MNRIQQVLQNLHQVIKKTFSTPSMNTCGTNFLKSSNIPSKDQSSFKNFLDFVRATIMLCKSFNMKFRNAMIHFREILRELTKKDLADLSIPIILDIIWALIKMKKVIRKKAIKEVEEKKRTS